MSWANISARALIFHSSVFLLTSALSLAQGVITTVAGSTWTFRGNGGPAVNAPLGSVTSVATDAAGNVYAADRDNNLVVRISPAGVLTVVTGNGLYGFSGDGGPATSASLRNASGVAVDAASNLYIADTQNSRIRKVSSAGTISTVAGNGTPGFSGDGVRPPAPRSTPPMAWRWTPPATSTSPTPTTSASGR